MNDELTAAERAALAALPRERAPSPSLEGRTVLALRRRGLLAAPRRRPATGWLAAGIAAALACFLGGLVAGQQIGSQQTADFVTQLRTADAEQMAVVVQRTGTAYIAALAALGAVSDTASPDELAAGREVAVNALWAAAEAVLRVAPDDPVARRIVHAFEAERQPARGAESAARRVVWF